MVSAFSRKLPEPLMALEELATDLRWTWSHTSDHLWRSIDSDTWEHTRNAYAVLQETSYSRFEALAVDQEFLAQLRLLAAERKDYLERKGWYQSQHQQRSLTTVAYFSMEYGLGEALPFYAGGLGILAGDFLKSASDLGVPLVAVGLLFHQGYFRQMLDSDGWQHEFYPSSDTSSLPIAPVVSDDGTWLKIALALPGRKVWLRIWRVKVGAVTLYLLDSNHLLNSPLDRGITSHLYPAETETRFLQQLALGIGGWRALQAMKLDVDICHLNEGHCAFVVLERARHYMAHTKVSLDEALLATRAGNIFTTHSPLPAAFDVFDVALAEKYLSVYANTIGVNVQSLIALGLSEVNHQGKFVPAYLGITGSIAMNAVSSTHRQVMSRLFQPLFPRWPQREVPLKAITNGVHVPSWDSPWADKLWTEAAGKGRWLGNLHKLPEAISSQSDQQLWDCKSKERQGLIDYVRHRYGSELSQRGASDEDINNAASILDPNILTLGLARRFTEYKRPNMLLSDPERFIKMLTNSDRPVQIVVSGKAHALDIQGKQFIQAWAKFSHNPLLHKHVVFLADYDIALGQEMVQGVDVWINTPRYSWEACGTSGMKILANGGLNLSELDGWWAEAYSPELGWAIGDRRIHTEASWDECEAQQLYDCLENEVIPEFYQRDHEGLPRQWIAKMRASMATLASRFSSNRMVREYTNELYLEAADRYHQRLANNGSLLIELYQWQCAIKEHWHEVHWGIHTIMHTASGFNIDAQVYLGGIPANGVKVQLYADATSDSDYEYIDLRQDHAIAGTIGGYHFKTALQTSRPIDHYTLRIIAWHQQASVPTECNNIMWKSLVD